MEHGASELVKEESHMVMTVKAEVDKAAQCTAYHGVQTNVNYTEEEPGLGELVKREPALMVKEEVVEDGWQGSLAPHNSLMEQPGTCTVLHSLSKECLETVCGVELRRLDTFQCEVCDAVYVDAHKLLQHQRDVHGPRPRGSLHQHVKSPQISKEGQQCATGSGPRIHICDYCQKTFTRKGNLGVHITHVHSSGSYKCSQCNRHFKCEQYLMRHMSHNHTAVTSPVVHTCDYCRKTYKTKQVLLQHIDVVHTNVRYRCSECNKEYKGKHLLQGHTRRVHSKEKHEGSETHLHICDYCKKMFTKREYVRKHIGVVHLSGSYKCHQCNKIFKCKEYLMQHKTKVHTAGSHQLHACTNCGQYFLTKQYCQRHEKIGKCTRPTASNTSAVASTSEQQHNVVVKDEPADGELDLGPVVFQHMDCNYRPYKEEPQLD